MNGVKAIREKDGPDAKCVSANCGFRRWHGSMSFLSAREVRDLARQHVRATGHTVEVEIIDATTYEPAGVS